VLVCIVTIMTGVGSRGSVCPDSSPVIIARRSLAPVQSAPNVAYNGYGNPAEIDSRGTNFNFLSTYSTGAWKSNLNIEVQGFNGTNPVSDETTVASATKRKAVRRSPPVRGVYRCAFNQAMTCSASSGNRMRMASSISACDAPFRRQRRLSRSTHSLNGSSAP